MKLLLDFFDHRSFGSSWRNARVIFVMAQINMTMGPHAFMIMGKIYADRLLVVFIIIRQMLQLAVFYYCIYPARCVRKLRRLYIVRVLNNHFDISVSSNRFCYSAIFIVMNLMRHCLN